MNSRGRKSAAELAVVSRAMNALERPSPPADLSSEHKVEWLAVVNRLPADWFPRETHQLLAQYCRHVVEARHVSQLIDACLASDDLDIDQYDKLLKMQEREGRALSSLATRMRITQQTTYDKSKKKPVSLGKPWDDDLG